MSREIDEALYRWQKEGWAAERQQNGQYILTHAKARPVICGERTSFQTVGTVQGEMQRALRDGPKPQAKIPPPASEPEAMPRRVKKKPKPATRPEGFFTPPPMRPAVSPYASPGRPKLAERPVVSMPRRPLAFENAALELARWNLLAQGTQPDVIAVIEGRYRTDEVFRLKLIESYRKTPQDQINALRRRYGDQQQSSM